VKPFEHQLDDENAPITTALNARREILFAEVMSMPAGEAKVDAALNGLMDLMADVIVAVHQLETGEEPRLGLEFMTPDEE
jgi:hypothetical protein